MEANERLRRINRSPGLVRTLRRVRGILPGDPHFGDPLSTAGTDSAGTIARLTEDVYYHALGIPQPALATAADLS